MRIRYNAPVTLTFAFFATLVLIADQLTGGALTRNYFSIGPTLDWGNVLQWPRLVLFTVGHAGWSHLIGNFAFILLLGPILEEKYGSPRLLLMMFVTALVTGLLNVIFLPTGLLGASGIVFMMIILISFTNIQKGDIPLTFIFVVLLYLAREVIDSLHQNNISQFAHILGGVFGSIFGFIRVPARTDSTPENS